MKNVRSAKKLTLNPSTLRHLQHHELARLDQVVGGDRGEIGGPTHTIIISCLQQAQLAAC